MQLHAGATRGIRSVHALRFRTCYIPRLGLLHASGDQRTAATKPPRDVTHQWSSTADQALKRHGGSERLPKAIREDEGDDGKHLVVSFAHARGSTGIAILEASRQLLPQASRGRDLHLLV